MDYSVPSVKWKTKLILNFCTLLILLNSLINANYVKDPNICGNPKCKVGTKFNYQPKTTYKYKYNIAISTRFDGASSNSSDLFIGALITLTFRSHCEGILQVKNAQISHNFDTHYSTLGSKSQQFDVNLSKYLLRFYFEDGEIAQICPHVNESIWALNIKKGILSNFQNTMQRFDVDQHAYERDINGDCMVRYSYEDVNGTTLSLTKRTELSTCYNRHQLYSIIPVTPYVFQKKYHKWSPINSSLTCSQSIDHKVYKSIICEEKHDYRAFYEQTDGATTRSNSKLILVIERNSSNYEIEQFTSLGKIRKRDNLLFDHRRPIRATHDNLHECKKSILLLCQLSNTVEFQPMYPDVFNKLIHTGRDLTVQAMTKLYKESAEICPTARKHLKDALPYIRNRASTKVMADIILSGEISEERVQDWLLIMAFFPRPDGETMDSVNRIIMKQNNDSQTMLSISTMINSYCKNHEDCQENHSVQTIIEKFESLFNESCKNGLDDDMAYTALKCIGNAGVLTETLLSSVNYCIKNENLPNEIRLAAIQSLRRLPCGSNDNLLISIFKNNSINEELRISSYQHIIRCPSYSILNIIRDVLENEDCNQVGSYVWSHLKTQMSSAYPSRVDIQAMLQDSHLNNKFNKDFRIFSKNYEYSFYLNNYGIGVFYEMNVIFSYKSYIPRNIVSNVTVLIFGEVVNIMEVNVYIEGLEQYVEKIFAESGTFNKDSISHILQIVRVVRNQPNPLKYLIQNLPFKKIFDHLRVSISLKIFGNELKFYRIRGHSDFVNILDNLDPITIIKRFLDGKEMTYESSTMLIDTSYVTPMSSGLPLKLNAIATTAININTMCFVNATVWSTNNALEMNGKLYPSVGLNFEGTLEVDAFFTETGIRFKGLMYTSTAIEGSFEMDTFKLMRLTFNLPLQKSNIFHVETELSLVTDEKFTNLEDLAIGRHKKELCTWKILEEVVGLKLCATSLFPDAVHILQSPILLFTGPINLALVLEKTDPTATKYIVQYETTTDMNKTSVMFEFRTPGSLTKRGMTANIELDTQSQNISLTYTSTRSQLVAEGYYRNSPLEKHVNFALDIDGKKHVDFQIGLDITPAKYGNTYYPKFLLAINDKRIVSLSGSIKWVAKKGISQCDIDIDFQTNRFETIIIGYVRISEASFATRVNLDYRFGGTGQLETVASELEIMDKSTKNLKYYIGQLQIESTAYPYINSITSLKFQKAQNHIDSHLKMVTLSKNDSNVLHVIWDYEQFKAFTMNKLNTSITVYKPNSDIDIKFGFIKQETTANFTTVIVVKYAQEKEIVTVLDINIPHASMFYYESRLRVTLHNAKSNEQMSIHTKIWEKLHNEYDLEFAGIWFSGHNVTLKGMYQDKSTLLVSTYALKFLIKSQLFNDILFNGKLINSDEEFKTEMQVEYNDVFYGIIFRHASEHTAIYHTFVQILYNTTIYSATNQIDFNEMKDILDLHFDQYRDVHIVIHGYTNSTRLDSGLEVKWDSNRDPSCKFIFLFQTNTLAKLRRDGRCILEYPGRVITSTFQILHIGVDYIMSVTAEWSPIDVITGDFHAIVDLKKSRELKFTGKVKTPFNEWENMSVDYQMKIGNQMARSNGSLLWQNGQKLEMDASYSYQFNDNRTYLLFITLVNSTISTVPSLKAILKYEQIPLEFDSELTVQTSPKGLLSAISSGKIIYGENFTKYFATLSFETPFLTLKKFGLSGDFSMDVDNNINGIIHLIGNGKKYITTLEAKLKYWRESRIVFHISTPFEKYKVLSGKFTLSQSRKHLLIDLRSSTSVLVAAEILYIYNNITNFDMKLRGQTSFTFINTVLIVGKIQSHNIDVRVGWNRVMVGLIGSSRYTSYRDIDYGLQIFTPIEGYSKGSAIARFFYSDRFDLEAAVSLAEKKVGLKIQAMLRPDEDFAIPYTPEPAKLSNDTANETVNSTLANNTTFINFIQNTSEPVEPIKPDLSSALFTLNEAPPGTVYWRSMFQLNTPLYPTVHGVAQINEDGYDYNFLMYLSFPFGQLKMTNDLTYKDIFNIENDMKVITTCKCLEELQTNFYIKGTSAIHLSSELNMIAQVFNKSYQGNSEFVYDYYSFNEENTDGVYNVTALLESPFQIVRHSLFNAYLKADNPIYIGNITVELNNNSVSLDGLIEVDEKYFVANVGAKINSSFLPIPMCRLIFHKDFTDVEKKLDIGVGLPNERGDSLVHYGIGGMWQYEDSNFMKYAVEIRTPYRSVGKIKCSIQYEHDQHKDISYLEAYLQYSNSTVLTATSELDGKSIKFNIDSTYETNKKIIIKGSFTNRGDRRNFDAVLSSDKEYKLVGWATVLPDHPIMLEVKLYKTKDDTKELLGGVINIVKVPGGYEMKTLIRKSGHHINVECEFMQLGDQGKQFHIMVATNYPGYESLIFDTILLNSNFELMMAKINASIKSKFLTTDLKLNANISLKNDAGLFNLLLTTPKISTDAKITWVFNWLEYLLLNFNGKLDYDNMTKELMSKFHFWNLNSKYDKISFGANINYNRKFWWLCTNGTLLWPNWKDLQLAVFIIVPDSGQLPAHRVLAKFKYLNDFSYFTHLIDYISHSTKFDFRTLSKVISSSPYIKGAFLVKTGRHRIFDNFSIKNSDEIYNIWNLLQSTNMKHDLLLEIQYKNFKPTQFVNLVLYYPKPTDLVTADLEFTSIKNLYARMNCSTPFKAFPEIKSYLNIVTNKTFYQRLAEIKWLKNNAIFNFTQLVTWMKKNQLTDGKILLDFPLTSRHIGLLAYKYESSDMKADGQSSLLYNGDTIMSGNYTRDSEFTAKRNKDKIIINVNNSFMPAGIIYNHKLFFLDPGSKWNSQDIKRIELFRLNDRSNFSIVGEIQFQENKDDKLTTFKAFHSRRKFIFEKLSEGKSKSITTANFTLKPNVWCATGFKLIDKDSVNGQEIQFNISYPRRLFTLNIDYVIDIDDLILEMTANPNLYSQAKHLTAIVRFNRKPIDNYHLMSIEIAHPYLVQNISAILSYLKNENVLANLNLSLEYANDINRKVILNMKSEKVVGNATKFYIFNVYAIHPASRLKITGYGNLRMGSKLLVFNKNITYSRSYMPLQFWITNAELNILKKLILIERKSLRDSSYLKAMFGKTGSSRYWANATLLKDKNFTVGSDFYIDIDGYKTELNMNFTPDASNRLRMLGAYNDHRDLKLIIWRTIYTFDVYDFKILARLNNSRMLTSSIKWRPEIYSEIMDLMQSSTNYIWNYAIETANFWTQYIRMESMDTLTDIWYDARPVLQDFLIDIRDLKHLQQDLKYFEKLFNDSYDANEFFMQDIYSMYQALTEEISFRDKMSHVPKIVNELWEVMGETSETIRQSVLWAVQSLKSIYEKIVEFLNGLATGETMDMISQYLQKIAAKYDKIIKDMHIKFLNYMEELWNETGNVIAQYWMKTLRTIEPAFIQLAHHIEAFFWQGSKRVIEFLYEKQSELMKSAVFRSNSNFTKDLEKFYDDITKNDFWTNMRKYSKMLYDIVTEKYFASVPFGYELNEIGTEIVGEIKELYNLPFIKFTVQIGVDVYDQVIWLYKYLNVEEKVQVVIPVIYNVIKNYSHTALDNEMINHPSSTKFIFKPESGEIYLEQKLPIPWHAFNLTPNFAEIPEYKRLVTLHSYIAPTNRTFWTYYYYFAPLLDPSNWLPPFSAQAMIIGGKHIVTFDGISYELEDCNCSYLLAKEFVFGTFSLALIDNNSDQPDIALIAYDKTLYFDFLNDVISLDNNQVPSLPLLINDIHIYAQEGLITVRSSKGFFLRCNFKFNVCTLRLSGWYFGKVAGLLGTMDNEPTTDFTTSNNNIVKNVDLFTKSWALESCTKSKNHQKYNKIDNKKDEECKKLFSSKNSSFVQCFTFVDPQPYYSMCLTSAESSYGDFICTAAYAYIQACGYNYIPIKIPTYCVQCPINEGFLEEGDFVILNGESVTQSTDVVFIVEAKSCNEYMRERRIVSTFSSILTKEFDTIGLHDNRYAVIAYGGTGIFDHPRSILVNNQIFTHAKDLSKYFEKIISGNGNTDIFGALRFATKLQFRPTVSKTFILMPCSDCDLTNMTVEYNVLNQEFIEKNITLHILMNADFDLEKLRVNKMFYGLDSERAYTKNDFKILKGDIELRRQIKLTKSMMGYCTTLALETNGTIFTGKKMGSENMALVKKFSSVFARRISATAQPDSCQTCECSSDDDGIEYIDCLPCTIPIPAYTDIDFRDNGTLSLLQAFEHASDII